MAQKSMQNSKTLLNKKQLINVSEHHKQWIESVVKFANEAGQETNQTDIIRALLDEKVVQDPETFVGHLIKMKKRARIEDLERRERALQEEKAKLVAETEEEQRQLQGSTGRHRDGGR